MRPTVPKGRKNNGNQLKNLLNRQIIPANLEVQGIPAAKQAVVELILSNASMLQPSGLQHPPNPPRSLLLGHELHLAQMMMIPRIFPLIASTGAQMKTRRLMKMPLTRGDRGNKKPKLIDKPIIAVLRLLQEMLQNRKRSSQVPSLAKPTPAMKQIKCAKVKVEPNEEVRTLSAYLR